MPVEAYYEYGGLDRRLAPVHKAIFRQLLRATALPYNHSAGLVENLPETEWDIGQNIEAASEPKVIAAVKAAGLERRSHSKFRTAHGFTAALEAEHLFARGLLIKVITGTGVNTSRQHLAINPAVLTEIATFVKKK